MQFSLGKIPGRTPGGHIPIANRERVQPKSLCHMRTKDPHSPVPLTCPDTSRQSTWVWELVFHIHPSLSSHQQSTVAPPPSLVQGGTREPHHANPPISITLRVPRDAKRRVAYFCQEGRGLASSLALHQVCQETHLHCRCFKCWLMPTVCKPMQQYG